jgi:hypothetical protein
VRVRFGERRSVVPSAAARSLPLAAAWTGAVAGVVCAAIEIAVVAVLWLPAAGGTGSADSAIRAGVLSFLAALHGGITVDGLPAAFVPLGMTILVCVITWRAGAGLADAANELGELNHARLVQAALLQAGVFAALSGVAARWAGLGTSSVSALAAAVAGFLLFTVTGGVAFVRTCVLGDAVRSRLPRWFVAGVRAAAAGVSVYLGAGALLLAASLVMHHHRVEVLSRTVGGGWAGLPILLLGVLAAPNAAIASGSYLAGPGFALGSGSSVSLGSTVHGTLPAFPVLGAVPSGPAGLPVWLLAAAAPLIAGLGTARVIAVHQPATRLRLRDAGVGAVLAAVLGAVLAWQGGGAIGSGRLAAVGASPWQFGLAMGAAIGVVATAAIGVLAATARWRDRAEDTVERIRTLLTPVRTPADEQDDAPDDAADDAAGDAPDDAPDDTAGDAPVRTPADEQNDAPDDASIRAVAEEQDDAPDELDQVS